MEPCTLQGWTIEPVARRCLEKRWKTAEAACARSEREHLHRAGKMVNLDRGVIARSVRHSHARQR